MALLDGHVAHHAALRPAAEAATDGEVRLSYRELDAEASRVAGRLRALGVGPGKFVLLSMKRSVWVLVAMIGVLRAGAAYVPLEVRTPPARRRQVVEDCRPAVVLCDRGGAAALAEDEPLQRLGAAILVVDEQREAPPATQSDRTSRAAPHVATCPVKGLE